MNCSLSIDGMGCGTSKKTPDENHRIIQLERELQEQKEKMEQLKKENDARGIENARQKEMDQRMIADDSKILYEKSKKEKAQSKQRLDARSEISPSTSECLANVSGYTHNTFSVF